MVIPSPEGVIFVHGGTPGHLTANRAVGGVNMQDGLGHQFQLLIMGRGDTVFYPVMVSVKMERGGGAYPQISPAGAAETKPANSLMAAVFRGGHKGKALLLHGRLMDSQLGGKHPVPVIFPRPVTVITKILKTRGED
jgi:hypothetical protein